MNKIDAVYTWVTMNDKKWLLKYKNIIGKFPPKSRYCDYGELELSVKLLLKYCDFIRNIYIITDNQIPQWYDKNLYPNIFIIDHKNILGSECCQPTFKSDSIECYLHKISNLSENFLYLNDDTFIGNYCTINNFIDSETNLPIARFETTELNNDVRDEVLNKKHNMRLVTLTNTIQCIEKIFNKHYDLSCIHQIIILNKSLCYETWKIFSNELIKNVKNPTRQPIENNISFPLLSSLLGIIKNKVVPEIDNYSINIYKTFNTYNYDNFNKNLENILNKKPQLFCINDVNDIYYKDFKIFKNEYLTKF